MTTTAHSAEPVGKALAGLESFDETMSALLEKWQIPGGALAVARDGRLVLTAQRVGRNWPTGDLWPEFSGR